MTYKEFKETIENERGYSVTREGDFCTIRNSETNTPLVLINLTKRYAIDTFFLTDEEDMRFIAYNWNTVSDFVATPPKERVQEQKYYIKLKLPDIIDDSDRFVDERTFLNVATNTKTGYVEYTLFDRFCVIRDNVEWKTQFTNQEFEEIMPKEYRGSFELIPVEEEE